MSAIDAAQDKLSKVSLDTMTVFAEMKALILEIKSNVDTTNAVTKDIAATSKSVEAGIEEMAARHAAEIAQLKLDHETELSIERKAHMVEICKYGAAHMAEINKYEEALAKARAELAEERAKNRDIELHFAAVDQRAAVALKK